MSDSTPKDNMPNISDFTHTPQSDNMSMSDLTPTECTPQKRSSASLPTYPKSTKMYSPVPKQLFSEEAPAPTPLKEKTRSIQCTPQKRSSASLPTYPKSTKMYSPVPKQLFSEEAPAPTPLKEKTRSIEDHVKLASSEIDTLLKSTLYSISKNDCSEAVKELEKIRRLNKSYEQKSSFLITELNKEINNHDHLRRTSFFEKIAAQSKVDKLEKESNAANEKVKQLQRSIEELVGYDSSEFEVAEKHTDANIS